MFHALRNHRSTCFKLSEIANAPVSNSEKSPICLRPSLRYKRQKLFLKQLLQKHSLKLRCPGVWDRLEKVSSALAAILAIDDFTSQSGTSQASRSLGAYLSQHVNCVSAARRAIDGLAGSQQPLDPPITATGTSEKSPIYLLQARTAEAQHCSRTTATSQPQYTRNKAEPQPHRSRITTESQPHDRHTRAESTSFEL